MKYDPVKEKIGQIVGSSVWLRILFYRLLDILLLRTWHVKRAVRQFADENIGNDISVLDAGSGFGQYVWRIHRGNPRWNITGVDLKEEQRSDCAAFFEKRGVGSNVSFETADLTKFVRPESFNLILSVDVMEHIEDDRAVFSNLFRSLLPGGWLIISTPSDQGGSDVHHEGDHSFIEEHVRDGYSISEISNKLSEAGFTTVIPRYTYGTPGSIAWKLTMKIPIIMLNYSWLTAPLLLPWYLIVILPALLLNYADTLIQHRTGTGLLVIAKKEQK